MPIRSHIAVIEPLQESPPSTSTSTSNPTSYSSEQEYNQARDQLINHEFNIRYDSQKRNNLNQKEKLADEKFESLRLDENQSRWKDDGQGDVYPAMPFLEARAMGMREGKVHKVITQMPKGALLHCHMDGSVDANFLISRASRTPGMHISSSRPLTSIETLHSLETSIQFRVLPSYSTQKDLEDLKITDEYPLPILAISENQQDDIFHSNYVSNTWIPLSKVRKTFPFENCYRKPSEVISSNLPNLKGVKISKYLDNLEPNRKSNDQDSSSSSTNEESFDSWLHSLMTLTPHYQAVRMRTSDQAWKKFISTFLVIRGLLGYEPILREYVEEIVKTHARDNVQYVETRLNFLEQNMISADGKPTLNHSDWVRIFYESVESAKKSLPSNQTFFNMKIIYATVRILSPTDLRWYLEDCLSLAQEFPGKIVGFDLVGHEDPGIPLKTYLPELLRFQQRCKELGLEIPFLFHAGETNDDGGHVDENLYDAILLGTKRIGHGFSLIKHPELMKLCKEREILIENCPISNQLLGYIGEPRNHPVNVLLNHGVKVALSSDDPCQFGNFGLSDDFFQFLQTSKSARLSSLGVLARNSLLHAELNESERQEYLKKWDEMWSKFIDWVVEEL